ncbi:YbaB/EbfC family nucleoid-associated protein [Streptomyces sp. NPDC046977]|uniref:YbaB/EbfC family nucleoid-associated protein n=1 Tax=Streptomyces sp. NPDC046977 TaxID=3154703 RepID=UPI0033E7EE36
MDRGSSFDVQRLLATARELQEKVARAQEDLQTATFQGVSGGGAVRATLNGRGDLEGLSISSAVADPGNTQGLADLIVSAVRHAQQTLVAQNEQRLLPMFEGLNTELRSLPR